MLFKAFISSFTHFVVIVKKEKSIDSQVINNGITTSIKNFSQQSTQSKIVFAEEVVVSTIDLAKR